MKIRISELFENAAVQAPEERTEEWRIDRSDMEPEFTSQEIRDRINRKLNVIPYEKERAMRQKWGRRLVAVALIAVIGTVTAFAAANVDLLKEYFIGDTSLVKDQVLSPGVMVSDNEFELTLEQVIADEHNAMIILSTVPLTEEARLGMQRDISSGYVVSGISVAGPYWGGPLNILYDGMRKQDTDLSNISRRLFDWDFHIKPVADGELGYEEIMVEMIMNKSTKEKQYWKIDLSGLNNTQGSSCLIYPNQNTNPDLFIEIPLKNNLETRKIELSAPGVFHGDEYIVKELEITPLGMTILLDAPRGMKTALKGEFYFRMKDGTIRSLNQLSELSSWRYGQKWKQYDKVEAWLEKRSASKVALDGEEWNPENVDLIGVFVKLAGRFWQALDPTDFQSIIVDDTEYSLTKPTETKKTVIDSSMKQFELRPMVRDDILVIPVEEMCDALGADFTWDSKDEKATIRYRDLTLELTVGSSIIQRNGEPVDLGEPVAFYEGKLISNINLAGHGLNVDLERTNIDSDDPHDWIWIVTP